MTTPAFSRPSGLRSIVALLATACAAVLVPWTVYLARSLPAVHTTASWSSAWVGFDIGLLVSFALTGLLGLRRHPAFAVAATATAALLGADAWFDVMTSTGAERLVALGTALLVELPLSAALLRAATATAPVAASDASAGTATVASTVGAGHAGHYSRVTP